MAYFGRKAQKPLQKPGFGAVRAETAQRVERAVGRLQERGRPERKERVGYVLRAARANRNGRSSR